MFKCFVPKNIAVRDHQLWLDFHDVQVFAGDPFPSIGEPKQDGVGSPDSNAQGSQTNQDEDDENAAIGRFVLCCTRLVLGRRHADELSVY